MGKSPDCREIVPVSIPAEGKLRDGECVNALRAHSRIRDKMPPLGIEPATLTHATHVITPLTKTHGGDPGAPPGGPGKIEK